VNFSVKKREDYLQSLESATFDVLIIGGGITGAGISLDATTRGINTILFEMQDFAAGSSSRSTKLIHGGLRYLKQFEVKLVAEVGKERAIVYENGPHVTTPEWMLLPIYKGGTFGKFSTSIGLRVYDFLAGVKKKERRRMLNMEETLSKESLLKKEGLLGGGYYVEYRTDDARLTIEVMKKAVELGAKAFNYMRVDSFIYDNGNIIGVEVKDLLTEKEYKVFAKKIINATGPWVDTLREKDHSKEGKRLKLSKGVHIVIDQKKFPLKQAVYYDTPDGRMVFAIPRDGKAYVGTTDTFYNEDIATPKMTLADQSYLIKTIGFMFPEIQLHAEDIESSWAGVRPLIYEEGKDPSEISRKDEIWQSKSGLITIAGGKLTGYRKMAEMTVDLLANLLKQEDAESIPGCQTKHLAISGGDVGGSSGFSEFTSGKINDLIQMGLSEEAAEKLIRLYGSNIDTIVNYYPTFKELEIDFPFEVFASIQYAIDHEMIVKPIDYFVRRTGALYFDISWVHEWKETLVTFMAQQLFWPDEIKTKYTKELDEYLNSVKPIN
jgi:glycerol-3-phosphate dehydrogenase